MHCIIKILLEVSKILIPIIIIIIPWWHLWFIPTTKKLKKCFLDELTLRFFLVGLMAVEKAQKTNEGQTFLVPRARCLYWIKIKKKVAFYESHAEMALLYEDWFSNVNFFRIRVFFCSHIAIFLYFLLPVMPIYTTIPKKEY